MTVHSKGPWSYSWDNGRIRIDSEEAGTVASIEPLLTSERELADAALICAAPDLQAALANLHEYCRTISGAYRNGLSDTDRLYCQVKDALAKATGEKT